MEQNFELKSGCSPSYLCNNFAAAMRLKHSWNGAKFFGADWQHHTQFTTRQKLNATVTMHT